MRSAPCLTKSNRKMGAPDQPNDYILAGRGFGLVAGADFKSVGGPPRAGRGGFDSHPFRFVITEPAAAITQPN